MSWITLTEAQLVQALSDAIFCINTFLHPDASDPEDVEAMESRAEETLSVLVALRDLS